MSEKDANEPGTAHRNWIIAYRRINEFIENHPGLRRAEEALAAWYAVARDAQWTNFAKVRETFNSADQVGKYVVFNVGGNKIRLVAEIRYANKPRIIYIKAILTHAEYDEYDFEA